MKTFPKWLREQYLEWQKREGEIKSVRDFAIYLGVAQQSLNKWINGKALPRDAKNITALANKLGTDVYEQLDMRPPVEDPLLKSLLALWAELAPEDQEVVEAKAKELKEQRAAYKTKKG